MASTILLKRSNTSGNDSYTGQLGEITLDTQERKLRIHDGSQEGGYTVANMEDVQDVIDQIDGLEIEDIAGLSSALSAIEADIDSIESDISSHDSRITSLEDSYIDKDGSVAFTDNVDAGSNRIINVSSPSDTNDAANKGYVDDEISALGDVFSYEGTIDGGTESEPLDLSTLSNTSAGAYYTVESDGYVELDTEVEFVNVNDAILFNASGGYRIIDNTNTEVSGTSDFISVSGSVDTGYTVDIAGDFKDRVDSLESDKADLDSPSLTGSPTSPTPSTSDESDRIATTQYVSDRLDDFGSGVSSISVESPITDSGTSANPVIGIDNATTSDDGAMSSEDKSKLDGIESGAQVNSVDEVNGQTGTVSLDKSDIGLGDVDNYETASESEATDGTSNSRFMTPQRVREFVEDGDYTIDGGTF